MAKCDAVTHCDTTFQVLRFYVYVCETPKRVSHRVTASHFVAYRGQK